MNTTPKWRRSKLASTTCFASSKPTSRSADGSVSLLHPASAEDLINEQDFERDERLPYWADKWPSSFVLAVPGACSCREGGRRLHRARLRRRSRGHLRGTAQASRSTATDT